VAHRRQPILERSERVTACALLFRSRGEDRATFVDPVAAQRLSSWALSASGSSRSWASIRASSMRDEKLVFDDALKLLPRESVVLELLESIPPTEAAVERCTQIRARGWKLALDDHACPEHELLSPWRKWSRSRRQQMRRWVQLALFTAAGDEVDEAMDEVQALQVPREQVLEAQLKAFAWRSPMI
jgi:c-di-GMP-related signal transduction protein